MKNYDLSCEDAQDKDNWRLRIKGQPVSRIDQENECQKVGLCLLICMHEALKIQISYSLLTAST